MSPINEQPPTPGNTIKAYCDCVQKETTWTVIVERDGFWGGTNRYNYFWKCMNCGKDRKIGTFDSEGNK